MDLNGRARRLSRKSSNRTGARGSWALRNGDVSMAAIEDDILTEFYNRLGKINDVTPRMIDELRVVLVSAKLKPEELVRIFAPPPEEEIP